MRPNRGWPPDPRPSSNRQIDRERSDVLARLGSLTADQDARLAHLSLEPRRRTPSSGYEVLVVLRTWPGGDERVLGAAQAHGIPTTWD